MLATIAIAISVASLGVSVATFVWNWSRTIRKLKVRAYFEKLSPENPALVLNIGVRITNPHKVPIEVGNILVTAKDAKGSNAGMALTGFPNPKEPLTLSEGGQIRRSLELSRNIVSVEEVLVMDMSPHIWTTKRIGGQRLFREWRRAVDAFERRGKA